MSDRKNLLGAFYIEGTDKHFFGLRDAKNYQMVKGGNILGPRKDMLYPDPFPAASNCSCGNRITPTGPFLGAPMEELPTKCADCGGSWSPKPTEEEIAAAAAAKPEKKKSGGFFGLFKRS